MYLIDASAFIKAKRHYYQFGRVPQFWTWLQRHAVIGNVKTTFEVFEELVRQDDELKDWIKSYKDDLIVDSDDYDVRIPDVLACYGAKGPLTEADFQQMGADPYLIACALHLGFTLVTEEVSRPKSIGANRKIPDICNDLSVQWTDIAATQYGRDGLINLLDFRA